MGFEVDAISTSSAFSFCSRPSSPSGESAAHDGCLPQSDNLLSLRVNLDMGKTVYAHQIQSDAEIRGTIVRTSTLPEELGRIEYLLSDKTGTLTRNGKSVMSIEGSFTD